MGEQHQTETGQNHRENSKDNEHTDTTGWQEVRRKKKVNQQKRSDITRSHLYFPKDAIRTTYFFTNFPEKFHAKQMLKAFLHYGDFDEVVIPAKRDKIRKRFDFARSVNVKEPERFAVKLDNIIIGREKIMVNMPRLQRKPSVTQTSHPLKSKTMISNPNPAIRNYNQVEYPTSKPLEPPLIIKDKNQPAPQKPMVPKPNR